MTSNKQLIPKYYQIAQDIIQVIQQGQLPPGSKVLYAHLGGQPALPAYAGAPGLG